ncbi:MAG: SDR family oxidoreductase [Pseudomonadota bacterium]
MANDLKDKVCITTGAASGIGRACCDLLLERGARVVLVDYNADQLEEARKACAAAGGEDRVIAVHASISDEGDMERMATQTMEAFGRIDALLACAGILRGGGQLSTIADTSLDEWNNVVHTNLTGTFLSNRAVLGQMLKQREGDIVNVSSTSGRQGRPYDGPYSASKFGIIGLSESLSAEVSQRGVRVQTVLPDAVETPLWEQNGPGAMAPPQMLSPARVAEFIVYLLELPRDTFLLNPVIAPFRSRRGKRGRK